MLIGCLSENSNFVLEFDVFSLAELGRIDIYFLMKLPPMAESELLNENEPPSS